MSVEDRPGWVVGNEIGSKHSQHVASALGQNPKTYPATDRPNADETVNADLKVA